MTMQYYPDNIRRFVGDAAIAKLELSTSKMETVRFENVDPPFPAETAFQDFLVYSQAIRKGVEMVSAAGFFPAENAKPG